MTRLKSSFEFPGNCLWVFLAYFLGLWWYSVPFTGDEKIYISTAMEMWQSHDWLHSSLMGVHSYYKPPFQYWTTLLSWSFWGFGNLGTYFPSAVATAGTAWGLGKISQLFLPFHQRTSTALAGIWFAACTGTLTYGNAAQMEIWTVFFYVLSWWAFLVFVRGENWNWLYLALGLAGLSGLVKSPIYPVFSVLGFWLYLGLSRKTCYWRRWQFYAAHLMGVLVGMSWYVYVLATDYSVFWSQYVQYETFSKVIGNGISSTQLWLNFLTFCIPFLLLLVPAFFDLKLLKKNYIFIISYSLFPSLFFSFFPYRTETYLYILVPLLTLILDWFLSQKNALSRDGSGLLIWISRANGVLILSAVLVASAIFTLSGMIPIVLGIALFFVGVLFCYFSWKCIWKQVAFLSLGLIFLLKMGGISLGENDLGQFKQVVNSNSDRKVNFYNPGRNAWHETGVLAAAVGRSSATTNYTLEEVTQSLLRGEITVLTDAQESDLVQIKHHFSAVQNRSQNLKILPWSRWRRSFGVPNFADLSHLADPSSPEWELRNKRKYSLLWVAN